MSVDTKPRKRYRATATEWAHIRDYFRDERCWCCGEAWSELHHILSRKHGGDDFIENLAPLCSDCHRRIEARDQWARGQLRGALMPSNLHYLFERLPYFEGWLERNYPVRAAA